MQFSFSSFVCFFCISERICISKEFQFSHSEKVSVVCKYPILNWLRLHNIEEATRESIHHNFHWNSSLSERRHSWDNSAKLTTEKLFRKCRGFNDNWEFWLSMHERISVVRRKKFCFGESREHVELTEKYEHCVHASLLSSFRAESNKRYISDEKARQKILIHTMVLSFDMFVCMYGEVHKLCFEWRVMETKRAHTQWRYRICWWGGLIMTYLSCKFCDWKMTRHVLTWRVSRYIVSHFDDRKLHVLIWHDSMT